MKRPVRALLLICVVVIVAACNNSPSDTVSEYFGLDNDKEYPLTFEEGTGTSGSVVALPARTRIHEVEYLMFTFVPPSHNSDGKKVLGEGLPARAFWSTVLIRTSQRGSSYVTFHFETGERTILYSTLEDNVLRHLKRMVLYLTPDDDAQTAF